MCTIGYEGASMEDFLATLCAKKVELLIDVRQRAISRKQGFSARALEQRLQEAGISYHHLVDLGDPKEGRDAAKAGHMDLFTRIFQQHLESQAGQDGLQQAAILVEKYPSCLLCYERDPNQCHRLLVANRLKQSMDIVIDHLGVRHGIATVGNLR
ncbi:MAG: DUF488 domain-containing protein [Magnetococcales bacterium]|nr:DUF488 domain-containing protein [Magnetococcales bacterium]NGZ27698.1 DUF488 domain-containing protein [Magnetococcales bacterium]